MVGTVSSVLPILQGARDSSTSSNGTIFYALVHPPHLDAYVDGLLVSYTETGLLQGRLTLVCGAPQAQDAARGPVGRSGLAVRGGPG
jgi:hypothetical protein